MRKTPLFILFLLALPASSKPGWFLREEGNKVELVTPKATFPIVGNLAPPGTNHYYVEIPLRELFPPEPMLMPSPSPTASTHTKEEIWEGWEEEVESEPELEAKPREPSSIPPRVIVEYDDSDRYVVEANKLFNKGKYYDATKVVEELLRKKPEHLRGWVMKGSLMYVQGQRDLARSAWEQALKLDPENTELKKMLDKFQ